MEEEGKRVVYRFRKKNRAKLWKISHHKNYRGSVIKKETRNFYMTAIIIKKAKKKNLDFLIVKER